MSTTVDAIELDAAAFRGDILGPADPGFDVHRRIWNGSIDRRPAAIARCAGVADVITAVKAARSSGVPVAVRSGGHSFPGYSVADDAFYLIPDRRDCFLGTAATLAALRSAAKMAAIPGRNQSN